MSEHDDIETNEIFERRETFEHVERPILRADGFVLSAEPDDEPWVFTATNAFDGDGWDDLGYVEAELLEEDGEPAFERVKHIEWKDPVTMTTEGRAQALDALGMLFGPGFLDPQSEAVRSLLAEYTPRWSGPALVAPTGWRRFVPGAHRRAAREHRRRYDAWVAAGRPDLRTALYIPRAVFVPANRKDQS